MNGIGILPDRHLSYVDHLVPLCQLMQIPLLVTEEWMKELIEFYYPPMEIILAQPDDYNLDPFLKEYDTFFYVDYFRKGNGCFQFWNYYTTKKVRSVMSLHGNPDKFWEIYWIEHLQDEDIVLSYGPQLSELMAYRGVDKNPVVCGNYRLEFYKAHESFFDKKVPFSKVKQTVLYAPTWTALSRKSEQRINFSPFFDVYRRVFDTLSKEYQLIVKLHPFLYTTMPDQVDAVVNEYPAIHFLHDFPLIYPLLKQIDIYLGDYSSIGYDFLYFDRPLFFLETVEKTALHTCGESLTQEELARISHTFSENSHTLSPDLHRQDGEAVSTQHCPRHPDDESQVTERRFFSKKCEKSGLTRISHTCSRKLDQRKKLYAHAFGEKKNLNALKHEILDACRSSSL